MYHMYPSMTHIHIHPTASNIYKYKTTIISSISTLLFNQQYSLSNSYIFYFYNFSKVKMGSCIICRNLIIFAGNVIIKLDLINSKIKTFSIVPGIIARIFIIPVLLLVSPFLLISVFFGINCFQKVPSTGINLEQGPYIYLHACVQFSI